MLYSLKSVIKFFNSSIKCFLFRFKFIKIVFQKRNRILPLVMHVGWRGTGKLNVEKQLTNKKWKHINSIFDEPKPQIFSKSNQKFIKFILNFIFFLVFNFTACTIIYFALGCSGFRNCWGKDNDGIIYTFEACCGPKYH